jgi:glycosyltransferase involved in cell wall biosynthesis
MAIYLDVSAAVHRRAGLGRYAENLAKALTNIHSDRYALFYNRERGIEPLASLAHVPACTVALGYKPWRMAVWLGQLARVGFDRLVPGVEIFHATEHLLLPLRSAPTILTVHDLVFRHLPAHHKLLNRWYLNLTMPLYCRRATHIISVSEHTKRDLVAAYGLAPTKITVVHEAAASHFRPQSPEVIDSVRSRYGLPERYLLFVGTVEPRKNLGRLLTVFERAHDDGLIDGLIIVGRRGWLYDDFFAQLQASPSRDRVILPGYVDDEDLPALYAGARAFVFPSVYEGFGLPVLEAMASGVPVVTSATTSVPEIGGDAALYFDPLDVQSMSDAVSRLLKDSDLQDEMRSQGLARAMGFSWERAARETRAVYDTVLEGG